MFTNRERRLTRQRLHRAHSLASVFAQGIIRACCTLYPRAFDLDDIDRVRVWRREQLKAKRYRAGNSGE